MFEGLCQGTNTREMAAESGRQALDTPWQPSAYRDKPAKLEALYLELTERLAKEKNDIKQEFHALKQQPACGDWLEPAKLEALYLDLIKSLEPVENEIRKILGTLKKPSACEDKPLSLETLNHDLIERLAQVKNYIREILGTSWVASAFANKAAKLEALYPDLIEKLAEVKKEIRETCNTLRQPSACRDKLSRLETLYRDVIERLEQVENEIRETSDTPRQLLDCGDKLSRLEALYHDLIEKLAQVKKEIRQARGTMWQPSPFADKAAKLEALYPDLIEGLARAKNEIRETCNTLRQPSACRDKLSRLETLYRDVIERLEQVENEIRLMESKISVQSDSVESQPQLPQCCHRQQDASDHYQRQNTSSHDALYQEGHRRAFPGEVTRKELGKTEEHKKLKEKIKELEAKNYELLAKLMSVHKNSENMNDPLRLSTVLEMYEMLRIRDWEKFRISSSLTYKSGSKIIKKLFDACEKDTQERTTNIFGALDIPPSDDVMTNSKQGVMQEIRNLCRYSYNQNNSQIYSNIIRKAGIDTKTETQRQFTVQCCKIYCFLLLQDPPVKAVWNLHEMHCLEHVDKKGSEHWEKTAFLWPIMKCGEELIVKGVVWDKK